MFRRLIGKCGTLIDRQGSGLAISRMISRMQAFGTDLHIDLFLSFFLLSILLRNANDFISDGIRYPRIERIGNQVLLRQFLCGNHIRENMSHSQFDLFRDLAARRQCSLE